nr:hypothetical protein [uncultured Actinoplanes sp.]
MSEPRVLFVRTARNDESNVVVLTTLTSAVRDLCRVEVMGDQAAVTADVIVLHVSPRDVDLPDFPFPPPGDLADAFADDRPITGRGLLREIGLLHRLGRLPDTIVVCDRRYQPALDDLIALGGISGVATDEHGIAVTPRLTDADREVGLLREAFRGITYDPGNAAALGVALRAAVADILSERGAPTLTAWSPS